MVHFVAVYGEGQWMDDLRNTGPGKKDSSGPFLRRHRFAVVRRLEQTRSASPGPPDGFVFDLDSGLRRRHYAVKAEALVVREGRGRRAGRRRDRAWGRRQRRRRRRHRSFAAGGTEDAGGGGSRGETGCGRRRDRRVHGQLGGLGQQEGDLARRQSRGEQLNASGGGVEEVATVFTAGARGRSGQLGDPGGQVTHDPLTDGTVHTVEASQIATDFGGALSVAGAELVGHRTVGDDGARGLLPLQLLQVLDRHLQDVGLLQFGVPCVIFFQCIQDEILQFSEAVVDASPATFLHDGLGTPSQFAGLARCPVGRHVAGLRRGCRGVLTHGEASRKMLQRRARVIQEVVSARGKGRTLEVEASVPESEEIGRAHV